MSRILIIGGQHTNITQALVQSAMHHSHSVEVVQDTEGTKPKTVEEKLAQVIKDQEIPAMVFTNMDCLDEPCLPPSKPVPFYRGLKKYRKWDR